MKIEEINFKELEKKHSKTEDCDDNECMICGFRDCPHDEPLHYHHDGCPACIGEEMRKMANENK